MKNLGIILVRFKRYARMLKRSLYDNEFSYKEAKETRRCERAKHETIRRSYVKVEGAVVNLGRERKQPDNRM